MFAKPECDNVLQPDPCINVLQPSPLRGSGCNTLSHSGLANVNTWKRIFYPLIDTRLRRASIPLKPASDIDWCPFRLHRCSRYNHRTTFRNHSPRASTSINTRLRRASFPLKPAPVIDTSGVRFRYDMQEISMDCQQLKHN